MFLSVFFLFSTSIFLGITLKMVKSLQTFEHLALPFAQIVDMFVREHKIENFVLQIFKSLYSIFISLLLGKSVKLTQITKTPSLLVPSLLLNF